MTPAPIKPLVSFEQLDSLDIRVGTIEAVEEVAGSNKLMRLVVNWVTKGKPLVLPVRPEQL